MNCQIYFNAGTGNLVTASDWKLLIGKDFDWEVFYVIHHVFCDKMDTDRQDLGKG